jgi:Undecaprenyl-phosphate galactose phosphotransferase WbaP
MAAPSSSVLTTESYLGFRRSSFGSVTACMISVDALGLLAAASLSAWVHLEGQIGPAYFWKLLIFLPFFLASLSVSGLYPGIALNPVVELQAIFKSVSVSFLFFAAATFFQHDAIAYSRIVVLVAWLLSLVFVSLGRFLLRKFCTGREWWTGTAVIFGSAKLGAQLASSINNNPTLGLRVIGVLDQHADDSSYGSPGFLGDFSLGPVLANSCGVRYAILALPGIAGNEVSEILDRHASGFQNILVVAENLGLSNLGVVPRDLGGVLGLEMNHRLLDPVPRVTKRALDFACAALLFAILSPLLIALWLGVRLSSRGPAFYRQQRIGENGETFYVYKFRTMVTNAADVLQRCLEHDPVLAEEWARDHKLRRDPRVTKIGRFLRKTSMDELPQLWNVLSGDMSLVGPRPIVDNEISKYGAKYKMYVRVRPGITGLWQVSGRNNTTYEQRVSFDDYYVRNWSVWLDLYILARTVNVVLTGDGAY